MKLTHSALFVLFVLALSSFVPAEARPGGGRSLGSRGSRGGATSRTYRAPSRPSSPGAQPYRSVPPSSPFGAPAPAGGGFLRNFGAGLAGGMLGSMLFRGVGNAGGGYGPGGYGGGGGGIGFLDILLFAGIVYLVYRLIRGRSRGFQTAGGPEGASYSTDTYRDTSYVEATPEIETQDAEEVLHQAEPGFDPRRFRDARLDDFFKVQAAFANRDLSPLRDRLTPELHQLLETDVAELKRAGRVNHLDNIAVRDVEIAEAWRETGAVWATVRFRANLVDYTTDEHSGAVVAGSRTEPVKFQELWTFVREMGFSATSTGWRLSAIEQEAE